MTTMIIETKRLIIRLFEEKDFTVMCAINSDPRVMEFFPSIPVKEETRAHLEKVSNHYKEFGYSLYALERKDTGEFIGFTGLLRATFKAHFTPATEIGWRLASLHQGKGFATEAAKAVLKYGFKELNLSEIVSFTAKINFKSINVMKKIGLHTNIDEDFDHPKLQIGSPLCRHVLYRIKKDEYETSR